MRDSPECHQTNSRKVSCWDLAGGPYAPSTIISHSHACASSLVSGLSPPSLQPPFFTLTFRFIFMYLLLFAFEVAPRDRILSVRLRNSGYVSLCIIHCSVDPEGCRSSNKCCLRVILPPFRHPVFANSRAPRRRSLCAFVSPYPLALSCPVISRLDIVIALYYCQKFSAFFTTSFHLHNVHMNLLNFLIC